MTAPNEALLVIDVQNDFAGRCLRFPKRYHRAWHQRVDG